MATTHSALAQGAGAHTPDLEAIRGLFRAGRREGHFYVALLGLRTYEPLKLLREVRHGLPYAALQRFQLNTDLPARVVADLIGIPARTLTRRKAEGRLDPDESDRLLRAARIFGRALELFEGDPDAARAWLLAPQPALGGEVPLKLATADIGAQEVEHLIGRLEHGIPS